MKEGAISRTVIRQNLEQISERIGRAAQGTGRVASEVTLVAVTKGVAPERIREAVGAGVTIFGENRVQEAQEKIPLIAEPNLQWHMIGHLQTNKIKTALSLFQMIESIDSVRLAREVSGAAVLENKVMPVLLEVNISGEKQKFGFGTEEIYTAIESMKGLTGIHIMGLMGMAPNVDEPGMRRLAFKKLKGIFTVCKAIRQENFEMKHLSMGMSDDFEMAIEEGSNMVRLGRAVFK